MRTIAATLMVALMALPVAAQITTPHVAGGFQGWDAGANPMTETAPGSGIWTASFSGLGASARHEFKITDGTWGTSHPGANSWLFSDAAGNVTITYDADTYADEWSPTSQRLGLSTDPGTWTAVGSFLSELGGSDWNNADPVGSMAPQGGGVYSLTAVLPPGTYYWKAVVTGSWDSISWDSRSIATPDWEFTTDAANDTAILSVNALAGTARVQIVPEPGTIGLLLIGGLGLLRGRSLIHHQRWRTVSAGGSL